VTNTTIATVRQIDCVDITKMSRDEIFDMCGVPTRQQAGDNVMLQVLDLLEYGNSQVLTAEHLQVIKSYVDEMLENNWSVKAGWEVQTLPQLLPPVEMGTTHTENTVTFTVTETLALAAIFVVACVIGYVTDWSV
jgi:hypothetical protein